MKYPKYVRPLKNSLHYQRDYPSSIKHLAPTKQFNRPLKIKVNEASERVVNAAWIKANEAFELMVKQIEHSDPQAFSEAEIERAAAELLRKRNHYAGKYEFYVGDPEIARRENRLKVQLQDSKYDLAEYVIPEIDNVIKKDKEGRDLTFEDKVHAAAYFALLDKQKEKPRTFSTLWGSYAEHKNIDVSSRNGKRTFRHWNRWLAIVGDHPLALNSLDRIHAGLDRFVEERKEAGVKSSTISRELNVIVACLRYNTRKYRLGWVIEPPIVLKDRSTNRIPLSQEEQKKLIDYCLNSDKYHHVGASIVLMLQGGVMPSEIGRLKPNDISLDNEIPYVLIRNETKTNDRKRLVPIVIGLEYLKKYLNGAVSWIDATTESTPSAAIKKFMRDITGNEQLSGHCLRHTFRVNAEANQANTTAVAAIGGWSGATLGVSQLMLNYGNEGITNSDTVRGLWIESKKIHKHLL